MNANTNPPPSHLNKWSLLLRRKIPASKKNDESFFLLLSKHANSNSCFNFLHIFQRSYIKKLEREASQSGQQLKKDGGKLSNHRPQREKNSRTAAWGNASRTERILATCVTCVGSVLVYGLYQLSAPFLI